MERCPGSVAAFVADVAVGIVGAAEAHSILSGSRYTNTAVSGKYPG
jgi:hypothetical protein